MQEEDNNTDESEKREPPNRQKPEITSRKKLENYLEELALKRQLEDWGDEADDAKE